MTALAAKEREAAKEDEEARPVAPSTARPRGILALVVVAVFAALYLACLARNDGRFVYCVDDAYIHLALAKNLALHGVYGVRPDEFAGASSSLAWPWMLALVGRLFGSAELAPLVFGLVAAVALAWLVFAVVREASPRASARGAVAASLAVLFLVPVVPVVFVGMEHVPHALAMLALARAGAHEATRIAPRGSLRDAPSLRAAGILALFAFAASSLRYETWFLAGPLVLLLAARRRVVGALAVVLGAATPDVAYALFARAHGAPMLPLSVLLKRTHVESWKLPYLAYQHLLENPHALVVLVLVALAWSVRFARARYASDALQALLALAFVTFLAHVTLAQLGWFFRYEAYAMTLALTAFAAAALEQRAEAVRAARALLLPLLIGTLPLTARALGGHRAVPLASGNIADQQITVARFFAEECRGDHVAVNDIGAVSYEGDVRALDLMGLGSPRVAAARGYHIDQGLPEGALADIAASEGVSVAAVYDDWFAGALPPTWVPVARWKIDDNRVCAKDTVTFYSADAAGAARLRARLERFAPRLPRRVHPLAPR